MIRLTNGLYNKHYKLSKITITAMFISLSVVLRLFKHVLLGELQIINFSLVFAIIAGYFYGGFAGFNVGFFSFILSDFYLGFGLWTIVDGFIAGIIGFMWSLFRWISDRFLIFILSFLSIFIYDIFTSAILYCLIGFSLWKAFLIGFIGLFLPVYGGYLYGIGPITEFSSSMLICILISRLNSLIKVNRYEFKNL